MDHLSQFIANHWQLSVAFVVMFIIIFVNEYLSLQKQGKTLSTEDAITQINQHEAIVIDLRAVDLYKKGHIIGAIRATESDFKLPKINKYKEKPLILVCARGIQSTALAPKLRQLGFTQPMVLRGGIEAWQAANLPLLKK